MKEPHDTQWTHAPWWVDDETGDVVAKDGDWEICTFNREDDNREADTNLIVAAPDLYEALEALEEMASKCDDGQYMDYAGAGRIFEDARKALAKARGEHMSEVETVPVGTMEELIKLREECDALTKHVEALQEKQKAETCACSYDSATDVCLGHSPMLEAVKRERDSLEENLEECRLIVEAYANAAFFDEGQEEVKEMAKRISSQWSDSSSHLKAKWQVEALEKLIDDWINCDHDHLPWREFIVRRIDEILNQINEED